MKRPMFEMSADARLLYQRVAKAEIGEVVTYKALAAEISRPVQGATPALRTALKRALRDNDMVFAPVRGEGMKRLDDTSIVSEGTAAAQAIRRRARRAAERITKVQDFAALTPAKQLEHTARLSVFSAIAEMSKDSAIKRLESVASTRTGELPIAETLRAFLPAS